MVPTKAACCIILSKDSKRNLDMQAGATAKDLKTMANYVVMNPMELFDKCILIIYYSHSESFIAHSPAYIFCLLYTSDAADE